MFVYYCVLFIIKIWKNAIFSTPYSVYNTYIRYTAYYYYTIRYTQYILSVNDRYPGESRTKCHRTKLLLLNHVTALHSSNTFCASFLNYFTPLYTFCCILIITCYTPVTLLSHPCNTFAVSLLHHLHCGILSVFVIVAFCPDTIGRQNWDFFVIPSPSNHLKYSLAIYKVHQ